jgi:hypothetical protein
MKHVRNAQGSHVHESRMCIGHKLKHSVVITRQPFHQYVIRAVGEFQSNDAIIYIAGNSDMLTADTHLFVILWIVGCWSTGEFDVTRSVCSQCVVYGAVTLVL